ncbi:tetratricopeptide repeat-containing sensor histidine kinase [Flavobacterium sp. TSSA_36]|uniref:tetratricopeptide repeat-containing sensor histidine kinase n=1 Tax=Flavobacterium sp. TSSA_36 TaxID=3447669 RepID=UPI003F397AC6
MMFCNFKTISKCILFLSFLPFWVLAQQGEVSEKSTQISLNKAIESWKNDQYETSLKQSNLALKKAIFLKNNYLIAKSYNVIGVNFDDLFMLDKAFSYYEKSLKYASKTTDDTLKGKIYNNLANIYFFEKKNYQKGIEYYKKSLVHTEKIADTSKIFLRKLNITWAYFQENQYKIAKPYLDYLNKYESKFADESTLIILNMLNGLFAEYKNDNSNANQYYQKAIQYGEKSNEKFDLSVTYYNYSLFLAKIKRFEEAYKFSKKYENLNNQILNDSKIKTAKNTGINLEVEEYKREINKISNSYKSKETYWLEQQSRNKKIVVLVIVISILVFLIFYSFSKNEKLKQYNRLKEIQSKVQQNIINATIDGQESERKKIAAFLHDNISALLSSAGMHLNVFSTVHKDQSAEIIKTKVILEETHHKIRDLSHELMPSLLVRFGLIFALDDLCEKNSNSTLTFKFKSSLDTSLRFEETLETKLYFIISELLNNIIKHSNATNSEVTIDKSDNRLIVSVIDNGKGFDDLKKNSIDGYGLNRIKARINNMKGEFVIISKKNQGTTIKLHVPIE